MKVKPKDDHRPGPAPILMAKIAIKLGPAEYLSPLKAVTFDGGTYWEVVERHPIFRGAIVSKCDVSIVEKIG